MESIKAKQSPTTFGDRKQTSDFISVYDIVKMIDLVIQKKKVIGLVLNAGTGVKTSINTLAEEMMDFLKQSGY